MGVLEQYQARYDSTRDEELSIEEYLDLCRGDPGAYATAAYVRMALASSNGFITLPPPPT